MPTFGSWPFAANLVCAHRQSFIPLQLGHTRKTKGLHLRNHERREGEFLFHLTTAGCGGFYDHRRKQEEALPEGSAFLIPMPSPTSYWCEQGEAWDMLWLFFTGDAAIELAQQRIGENGGHVFHAQQHTSVASTMNLLLHHQVQGELHPARASGLLCELLHGLTDQNPQTKSPVVDAACRYLKDYMHDPDLTIESVAAALDLSRHHFSRLFSQQIGRSPIAWLTEQRLERAVQLIGGSSRTLADIATMVGYREAAYFSTVFRKRFGYPPSRLRALRQLDP